MYAYIHMNSLHGVSDSAKMSDKSRCVTDRVSITRVQMTGILAYLSTLVFYLSSLSQQILFTNSSIGLHVKKQYIEKLPFQNR